MEHGVEVTVVLIICFTLTVGAALRMASGRVPYTIAMLVVGFAAGLALEQIPHREEAGGLLGLLAEGAAVSPELIVFVFLPILVFESAFALDVYAFRKNLGVILTMAGPVMLASTGMIAVLMLGLTGLTWQWGLLEALVFGALISATDPVAVVALLREMGAPRRLGLLIEGESLLNDGTAIVIFSVLMGVLTGAYGFEPGGTLLHFLWVTLGGLGVGLVLAIGVTSWLSRTFNAPLVEITLTVILAYLSMLVAEAVLHVSGVIAVVTAGLWMSGRGRIHISPEVSHFLHRFWEMLAYLANTLIFFLVGLVIATQIQHAVLLDFALIAAAWVGIMAVRFLLSFGSRPLTNRVAQPVARGETAVVAWGGMRGAVSLALGLVVSQHPDVPAEVGRQILMATAGVVLLTILVNGSSMGWLLQRLGFDRAPPGDRLADLMTHASVMNQVEARIEAVSDQRDLRTVDWSEVRRDLERRQDVLHAQIDDVRRELESAAARDRIRGYWRQALNIERESFWAAFAQGTLGARATRILDHEIDLQLDRLVHGAEQPAENRTRELPIWRARLARWLDRSRIGYKKWHFELLALRYDLYRGEQLAAERVLRALDEHHEIDEDARDQIRATYRGYLHASKERLEDLRANLPEVTRAIETHLARRIQLNFEREDYQDLSHAGAIDASRAAEALADVERRMKALLWAEREMTLPETVDLCRSAPLFAALDERATELLAELTIEKALPPEEVLFRQGEQGDSMFIIARGAVAVIRESGAGRKSSELLDILGGGDILGEMALLTGEPRTATARAVTTVVLGEISRESFEHLMETQPHLRDGIWKSVAERRFDNHLRGLPVYAHMSRDDRTGWFRRGSLLALEAGDPLPANDEAYAFVVSGSLMGAAAIHREDSLIVLRGSVALRAVEPSRVAVLPSVFEPE